MECMELICPQGWEWVPEKEECAVREGEVLGVYEYDEDDEVVRRVRVLPPRPSYLWPACLCEVLQHHRGGARLWLQHPHRVCRGGHLRVQADLPPGLCLGGVEEEVHQEELVILAVFG